MLRCPPTRLGLRPSEAADWVTRQASKETQRQKQASNHSVRLDSGPRHLTQPGIVCEDDNVGRKRAESCSSEATVCSDFEQLRLNSSPTPDDLSSSFEDTIASSQATEIAGLALDSLNERSTYGTEQLPEKSHHQTAASDRPTTPNSSRMQGDDIDNSWATTLPLHLEGAPPVASSIGKLSNSDSNLSLVLSPANVSREDDNTIKADPFSRDSISPDNCRTGSPGKVSCSADSGKSASPTRPVRTNRFGPPIAFPQRTSSRQHLIEYERSYVANGARMQKLPLSEDLIDLSSSNSTDNSANDLSDIIQIRQISDRMDSHGRHLTEESSDRPSPKSHVSHPVQEMHQQQGSRMPELTTAVESMLLRDSPLSELTRCLGQISAKHSRFLDDVKDKYPGEYRKGSTSNSVAQGKDIESMTRANRRDRNCGDSGSRDPPEEHNGLPAAWFRGSRVSSPSQSPMIPSRTPRGSPQASIANSGDTDSPVDPPQRVNRKAYHKSPNRNSMINSTTPKVSVYDDSLPPSVQPQTPADISQRSHRTYRISGGASHDDHSNHSQSMRHKSNGSISPDPRHRYKALPKLPVQDHLAGPSRPTKSSQQSQTDFIHRNDHSSSQAKIAILEEPENDLLASMEQLERDRQTRALRQRIGQLEITPPPEGRFERHFSS